MPNDDLFAPVHPAEKLNPLFRTISGEGYEPARALMRGLFKGFEDKDGNFVEQFQTAGFDARLWELYLYAYLSDGGYELDATFDRPDFIAQRDANVVCIEAVTTNPPQGSPEPSLFDLARDSDGSPEAFAKLAAAHQEIASIRLGTALKAKLSKRYWELAHVAGKPLVLAIEPFHDAGPIRLSDVGLANFLFGSRSRWHYDSNDQLVVESEVLE